MSNWYIGLKYCLPFKQELLVLQIKLNLPYLILLSTSHHVEEEIYTALIHNGQPLQESYLIYKEGERERDDKITLFYFTFYEML